MTFKGLLHPVHLDNQRDFVADERVGRLIGLRPNPQLEVSGSKLGLVQDFEGCGDALVGGVVAPNTNVLHLRQ